MTEPAQTEPVFRTISSADWVRSLAHSRLRRLLAEQRWQLRKLALAARDAVNSNQP